MGWLTRLLANREARRLALELAEKLVDEGEDLAEYIARRHRPATESDLADSLAKFAEARRRASR